MIYEPLRLAELGYRVFPLSPGQKTPLVDSWVAAATTDEANIELWISQYPTANWGVATEGLIVIDVDPGAEHWPENEKHAAELASTPVIAITPRGGRHYYFRQPAGVELRNTQNGQLAEHVDTRANGGYVAASPSTVNGVAYKWLNGDIDTRRDELPIVPAWIVEKLSAAKRKERVEPATSDSDAVPEGQRNGRLTKLAGSLRHHGVDLDGILVALADYNARRCNPPLDQKEVETIARSISRYAPGEVKHAVAAMLAEEDFDDEADGLPEDPGALPADLLKVPGFIGEVMAHNLAAAYKPQPALALAGALSLLATLTGRKVTDTQGTRTNLYCIGVCNTSQGKERARLVNVELLYNSGLERLIGPEGIGSAQGLAVAVAANPAILFQLDEFGKYLGTMGSARESYLYNIPTVLTRMFTTSASIYRSDAVVDPKKVVTIYNPNPCLYATTTPDALYDNLNVALIKDGFLSRVLVFDGDNDVAKRMTDTKAIPPELVEQIRLWGSFTSGGNLNGAYPEPLVVKLTSAARSIMYEYDSIAQQEQKQIGEPLGSLWPRAAEKANKLALLYACSENPKAPIVTDAAAIWATEVVSHLTKRLVFEAARRVCENGTEHATKRLSRLIEDAGAAGMSQTGITRATLFLKKRERQEYLETLIESGVVFVQQVETKKAGRPKTVFTHKRFRAG